jgi:hypothetical protein
MASGYGGLSFDGDVCKIGSRFRVQRFKVFGFKGIGIQGSGVLRLEKDEDRTI